MSSTPTTRLRLVKQGTGDNFNSWGTQLNTGALDIVDEAFGYVTLAMTSADVTLTSNNYTTDQARRAVIKVTGTGAHKLVLPGSVDKEWLIDNTSSGDITVGTASGVAATVRAGVASVVYSDGTDAKVVDPTLDKIKAPAATVALGAQKIQSSTAPSTGNDLTNKTYVDAQDATTLAATATSATAAATSATASATSATASATSATASAASATASAASATSAAASLASMNPALYTRVDGSTAFTAVQTGVTPTANDATTKLATTLFVDDTKYKARAGNVVSTLKTTIFTTSSGTLADVTGLSAAITPAKTTSRVRVTVTAHVSVASAEVGTFRVLRGSTDFVAKDMQVFGSFNGMISLVVVDSPATTSSTTYKLQARVSTGVGPVDVAANGPATITVEEIGA